MRSSRDRIILLGMGQLVSHLIAIEKIQPSKWVLLDCEDYTKKSDYKDFYLERNQSQLKRKSRLK